jgi:hypothetical protein
VWTAYAKGQVKEKFSPITGKRYPIGKNHDSVDLDAEDEEEAHLKVPKNNDYAGNRRNNRGKGFKERSTSPYQRPEKGKGRNPNYKGRH